MSVFAGKNATLFYGSGSGSAFTDEAMTSSDQTLYTISDSSKELWHPTATITVKADGVTVAASEYDLIRAGGRVRFHSARGGAEAITVSGTYLTKTQLGEAKEWSLDLQVDTVDASVFGDNWKEFQTIQRGGSGSISRWWVDEFFLTELANPIHFVLYTTGTLPQHRYICLGRLTTKAVQVAQEGLVEESLDFDVVGEPSFKS